MQLAFILIVLFTVLCNAHQDSSHGIEQLLDQQTEISLSTQQNRSLYAYSYNKVIKKKNVQVDLWFKSLNQEAFQFIRDFWPYYEILKNHVQMIPKYKVSF